MTLGWSALITPEPDAVAALRASWAWLVPEPFYPLLFSTLGDVFFRSERGDVYWLNTGFGEVSRVADSEQDFQELLATDRAQEWFLPPLEGKGDRCSVGGLTIVGGGP